MQSLGEDVLDFIDSMDDHVPGGKPGGVAEPDVVEGGGHAAAAGPSVDDDDAAAGPPPSPLSRYPSATTTSATLGAVSSFSPSLQQPPPAQQNAQAITAKAPPPSSSSSSSSSSSTSSGAGIHPTPPTTNLASAAGMLASWFSTVKDTVVSEAAAARNIVSRTIPLDRIGGLTNSAGDKVTRAVATGLTSLIDSIVPESRVRRLRLRLGGQCNARNLEQLAMESVSAVVVRWRDEPVEFDAVDATSLRSYVENELGSELPAAYDLCHVLMPSSSGSSGSSSSGNGAVPALPLADGELSLQVRPVRCHDQLLHVCVVQGLGSIGRCISQSVRVSSGAERDPEWERLVVRSALRSALEDWVENAEFAPLAEADALQNAAAPKASARMTSPAGYGKRSNSSSISSPSQRQLLLSSAEEADNRDDRDAALLPKPAPPLGDGIPPPQSSDTLPPPLSSSGP